MILWEEMTQASFDASGSANSPRYVPKRGVRIHVFVWASEAGEVELYLVDRLGNEYVAPGSLGPLPVASEEMICREIDLLIGRIFRVVARYTNLSDTAGTARFWAAYEPRTQPE